MNAVAWRWMQYNNATKIKILFVKYFDFYLLPQYLHELLSIVTTGKTEGCHFFYQLLRALLFVTIAALRPTTLWLEDYTPFCISLTFLVCFAQHINAFLLVKKLWVQVLTFIYYQLSNPFNITRIFFELISFGKP